MLIEDLYASVVAALPTTPLPSDDDANYSDWEVKLDAGVLPPPIAEMSTRSGTPNGYRSLALLILAQLFHEGPEEITLTLTGHNLLEAESRAVHRIKVMKPARLKLANSYELAPHCFTYYGGRETEIIRDDWHNPTKNSILPVFRLWSDTFGPGDRDPKDTICGFGSDIGSVTLAQLLLDIGGGWDSSPHDYALEPPGGFGGVGPMSLGAKFFLPGHFGFDLEQD